MAVFLKPNDRLLQTVDCVWYETAERAETWWKDRIYSDEGMLRITDRRLIFEGKKYSISMPEILDIRWKKPKGAKGDLKFICVDFKNEEGKRDSALFFHWGKRGHLALRWGPMIERTNELFRTLVEWRENVLKEKRREPEKARVGAVGTHRRGETVAYVPVPCPSCGYDGNRPDAGYCGKCGKPLRKS